MRWTLSKYNFLYGGLMNNFYLIIKSYIALALGVLKYLLTKKNSEFSYQAMIRLFCLTQGHSTRFLVNILKKLYPPKGLKSSAGDNNLKFTGVLGSFSQTQIEQIRDDIEKNGYHVFETKLDDESIKSLTEITQTTEAQIRRADNDPANLVLGKAKYSGGPAEAIRYDYSSEDLLKSKIVQKLISDKTILSVARSYLGVEPVIDIITMWWHTDFGKHPDSNAAQLYHFDMDRIKWLKFFFYLTDVDSDSGPHCFVKGTHNAELFPEHLLRRGYVRINDEEVRKSFSPEDIIEFTGRRGTIIAEDTAGLHKGKHVIKGARLIFQLEFAVSLFGSPNLDQFKIEKIQAPELQKSLHENPRVYEAFELN